MGEGLKITHVLVSIVLLSQLCWTHVETALVNHFTSTYVLLCYDACRAHEKGYYWCNTKKGWDYCSLLENTDYKGNECKDDHPCATHGKKYYWCYTKAGTSGYCGKVELKTLLYRSSTYQSVCRDECSYDEENLYYWCNTDQGWDYCSPTYNVTFTNKPCRSDHPCDTHGNSYTWCRTASSWNYCGLIEPSGYHSTTGRQKRAPDNQKGDLICTETNNSKEIRFYAKKNEKDIADSKNGKREIENDLISHWSNNRLRNKAMTLLKSTNFRIDQQGNTKNVRFYNLQIQRNKSRQQGESTTFALVVMENNDHILDSHVQFAFRESLNRLAKVTVEVGDITPVNQKKKCK